jgi:hypothetical protein
LVGVLATRIVSESEDRPSADMLLVHARRTRLRGAHVKPFGAQSRPETQASRPEPEPADVIFTEEDEIIENAPADQVVVPRPASGIDCYRSLSTVSLARLAWSGAIDHALLHEAIACAPVRSETRATRSIAFASVPTLRAAPIGEAALHVRLGDDDVEAVERALDRVDANVGGRLATATLLPDGLLGAPAGAAMAAAQALTSYRASALVAAWREVMGAPGLPEVMRDRDSAAVRLLSTLRALLGEA